MGQLARTTPIPRGWRRTRRFPKVTNARRILCEIHVGVLGNGGHKRYWRFRHLRPASGYLSPAIDHELSDRLCLDAEKHLMELRHRLGLAYQEPLNFGASLVAQAV